MRFPVPHSPVARLLLQTITMVLLAASISGCTDPSRKDLDYTFDVFQTVETPELEGHELVQFESVFWEPDDTVSLRKLIVDDHIADGRTVLEIGTGTGLISLVCLANGAKKVIATDINPAAVANARYNAARVELDLNLEVRQVEPENPNAFAVVKPKERFDLILSNPPWEDGKVNQPGDHAFYDPDFALMDSLLDGLPIHLNPGGRCLLAYGHTPAITRLLSKAKERGFQTKVLDDRKVDQLAENFLPGMLIEIRLGKNQIPKVDASSSDSPSTLP
ncbi:MAG: methyltransferase domain-containing protein [Planctomycetales bacterium]|nr:methyltransferase domain-containing protein [Planctomycetales bacterium]